MEYQVIALHQQVADEVRATHRAPHYGHPAHIETATGTGPCRLCLRPFRKHEEDRILFTYNPFPWSAELPSPGPIFIHRLPCPRFEAQGFPPELRTIPLVLEGYDDLGVPVGRAHAVAADPDAALLAILARRGVEYAHARHADAGCFIARVERRLVSSASLY